MAKVMSEDRTVASGLICEPGYDENNNRVGYPYWNKAMRDKMEERVCGPEATEAQRESYRRWMVESNARHRRWHEEHLARCKAARVSAKPKRSLSVVLRGFLLPALHRLEHQRTSGWLRFLRRLLP